MKFKLKLLDKAENVLQKIIRVFAQAFISHDRHTLFALEESEPPRTTYTCESVMPHVSKPHDYVNHMFMRL
jgi:hypothetical protein